MKIDQRSIISVVTLSRVLEGSEVDFLVKRVFSPIPPAWVTFVPSHFHYHVVNPVRNLFFYVYSKPVNIECFLNIKQVFLLYQVDSLVILKS